MADFYWFRIDSQDWPVFYADWTIPDFSVTINQSLMTGWEWQQATGEVVEIPS